MNIPILLGLLLFSGDPVGRWPGFLGAGSTPVDANTIPVTWSPTENMAWSRPLVGYGQSSPIIWGDRVYVTTVEGEKKEKTKEKEKKRGK